MRVYKYLYYNLYRIWLKKKNETENARMNAVITLTFSLWINMLNIALISFVIFNKDIFNLPESSLKVNIWIGIIIVFIGILNYLLLGRKKQHNKIIDKFETNSKRKNKTGGYITLIYILITFSIPLCLFFSKAV